MSYSNLSVVVKTPVGKKAFAFFTSKDLGDIFVHHNTLKKSGFKDSAMVEGHQATVDAKMHKGKLRVVKIHKIIKPVKTRTRKRAPVREFQPGEFGSGVIKVMKPGFGFIQSDGHKDIFFPVALAVSFVADHLKEDVKVRFEVAQGEKGVLACITDVIFDQSMMIRSVVDRHNGKVVVKVTAPTGHSWHEIHEGDKDGPLVSGPIDMLCDAREMIGHQIVVPKSQGHGKKTNDPSVSQAMKGSSTGKGKKAA